MVQSGIDVESFDDKGLAVLKALVDVGLYPLAHHLALLLVLVDKIFR